MPPKSPACCRAVQRKLLPPSDSVWMSDGILSSAFEHFYAFSRTARRYGSSVPGPMECRRRMGKRRMTYQSEAVYASPQSLAVLWGLPGATENAQWQWEAPKTRPTTQESTTSSLPIWLANWDTTPPELTADSAEPDKLEGSRTGKKRTIQDDLDKFRAEIGEALLRAKMKEPGSEFRIHRLFQSFNQSLKQNLGLGLVSDKQLISILQLFPKEMQPLLRVTGDPMQRETHKSLLDLGSHLMTTFFQTIWEGIKLCTVLTPVDINGSVMNTFLLSASPYAGTKEIQTLVRNILQSVPIKQLIEMRPALINFMKVWSGSWSEEQRVMDCAPYISAAEDAVSESGLDLKTAHKVVMDMEEGSCSMDDLDIALNLLKDVKENISKGIDAIAKAENASSPWRVSVDDLARTLDVLPAAVTSDLIRGFYKQKTREAASWRSFRYRWLFMVAKMRSVDDELFTKTWQDMENWAPVKGHACHLTTQESSDLILTHWISQGYFKESAAVRNTFEASMRWSGMGDFGLLIRSADIHREKHWERTKGLFDLLVRLNKHKLVPRLLERLLNLSLKYKPSIFNHILSTLSARDPLLAWKTFEIFQGATNLKKPYGDYRLEYCPELVIALIRYPQFNSNKLWEAMKIPLFNGRGSDQGIFGPDVKRLRQNRIDLIHLMATEFSHCPWRPPRVRLRNLLQCAWYLRYHRVPLSPELTKAFSHTCITRNIIEEYWIHTDRARWVLGLVAWAEGKQVAETVAETAMQWRAHMKEQDDLERRRTRNPIYMFGET